MTLWFDKRYKTYRYLWRENGRQRMKSLGKDRKVAEFRARELDRQRDLGEFAPLMVRTTVEDHLQWFIKYHLSKKRPETRRAYGFCTKKIMAFLQAENIGYLDQITRTTWERLEKEILRTLSRETRNDILAVLSIFISLAIQNNSLRANPLKGVKRRLKSLTRRLPKVFTDSDIVKIRAAAPAAFLPVIDLILLTGLRRSEIWALEWEDIDFKGRMLTIQAKPDIGWTPKDYEIRSIDLSDQAIRILQNIERMGRFVISDGANGHLMAPDGLTHRFGKICAKAGLVGGSLHSLRRTYATRLDRAGASLRYIQEKLGHEALTTTQRYLHPDGERHKDMVRNLTYSSLEDIPAQAILKQDKAKVLKVEQSGKTIKAKKNPRKPH